MSILPVPTYPTASPYLVPSVPVMPMVPVSPTGLPYSAPLSSGWTDAYVGGFPVPVAAPAIVPAPVAVATSPVGYAPLATGPAPASIPALLEAIRKLLIAMGNGLAKLVGTPSPGSEPTPANPGDTRNPSPKSDKTTRFVVSSFNILGSNHTRPGGTKSGYAPGTERIREASAMLEERKVDVAGFQELQPDQAREFLRVAGDTFGLFPGNSKGGFGSLNSVAWRKDRFKLVEAYTVAMPSHRGRLKQCPVLRLRDRKTGEEVYVVNVHNAPGFHKSGAQQHWRDKATDMQVELLNKLKRSGLPVILTGDMNEKQNYFRRMSSEAGMNAANELPNGQLPKVLGVDWIFGSREVSFKGFKRLREAIAKKVSDHPMIVSKVQI